MRARSKSGDRHFSRICRNRQYRTCDLAYLLVPHVETAAERHTQPSRCPQPLCDRCAAIWEALSHTEATHRELPRHVSQQLAKHKADTERLPRHRPDRPSPLCSTCLNASTQARRALNPAFFRRHPRNRHKEARHVTAKSLVESYTTNLGNRGATVTNSRPRIRRRRHPTRRRRRPKTCGPTHRRPQRTVCE